MKLIAPGVAGAAFALTLGILAWHAPRPAQDPPPSAAPAAPVRQAPAQALTPPPQPEVLAAAPAPVTPQDPPQQQENPETQPVADDSEAVAEPPTLPDSAALPAYQDDQIARHADGARSARSR